MQLLFILKWMRKQITSLPPKPQPSHTSPLKLRHHPNSKECKRFRRKTSKGHMTHFKKKNKVFIFDQTILMHLNICIKCYHLVQITVECHFWIPSMNKNVEIIALIINRKKKKSFRLFTLVNWEAHVLRSCQSPQSFIFHPRWGHQVDVPVFSWDGPLQV